MIRLTDVSKVYRKSGKEIRALDGLSLSVSRGEFVAVRGASGSGKTTLLLTTGGMIRPTAGQVLLDGEDLYSLPARRRARLRGEKIGFVFQMFHLVPYLNVWENVLLPTLAGARPEQTAAHEMVDRLGLTDRLGHRPAELSTGERQRVALARALLTRPKLILADEPTGNLDPDNAEQVMDYLAQFHQDGGTVLLVTHHELADRHAQKTFHLDHGRIATTS